MSLCEIDGVSKIDRYNLVRYILAFGGLGQNLMDFGIFEHNVGSIARTGDRSEQVYRRLTP